MDDSINCVAVVSSGGAQKRSGGDVSPLSHLRINQTPRMAYIVVRTIKGRQYQYLQRSYNNQHCHWYLGHDDFIKVILGVAMSPSEHGHRVPMLFLPGRATSGP